ncbi:hypothetical protein [Candidatus Bartonella washoeensis]|uniref:hypothetical protein n=1 Tax=Candidatus Bartonella washoeensis TaxID=186739 RepID=UPI0002FE6BD4|nr:hypothetical protein [Bartonella washoeensis]
MAPLPAARNYSDRVHSAMEREAFMLCLRFCDEEWIEKTLCARCLWGGQREIM